MAGSKRPKISWGQFLDAAPYFMELLWSEEDPLGPEWAPLVRAATFYDVFRSQVENGGVSQYLFNKASSLPHFNEAPEIVRQHPLFLGVAALMAEVHQNRAMVRHFSEARDLLKAMDAYRSYTKEYDSRAEPVYNRALVDLQYDIVLRPHAYFDISPAVDDSEQIVELDGATGRWRMKFIRGFPIGPNFQDDKYGCRILRFSSSRSYLEFDSPRWSSTEPDLERNYVDLVSGVSCRIGLTDGRVETSDSKIHLKGHGLREKYGSEGRPEYSVVALNGVSVLINRRDLPDSPFSITRPLPSGDRVVQRYFGNGQLNTERIISSSLLWTYTRCFDESGVELAPGGNGIFREIWSVDERGARWRVGKLVDSLLDGEFKYLEPDGSVWETERYDRGKMVR